MAQVLEALDFNAVHSSDRLAAAYFGQAATQIRHLQRRAAYWERQFIAEKARRVEADQNANIIAEVMGRIIANLELDDAP